MKNKALIIFGILLLTSGVYASKSKKISVKVNNYNAKITSEEAKNLALNHSKVSKNLTKVTKLMLGKENKKLVYEVEFTTLNKKYKYGIDANTGKILAYSQRDKEFETSMHRSSKFETPVSPAPIAEARNQNHKNPESDFGTKLEFKVERNIANAVKNSELADKNSSDSSKIQKSKNERFVAKMANKTDYTKVVLLPEEKAREIMLQNISGATDSDITRLVIKYENNRFIYSGKVNHEGNKHVIKLDGVTGEVIE